MHDPWGTPERPLNPPEVPLVTATWEADVSAACGEVWEIATHLSTESPEASVTADPPWWNIQGSMADVEYGDEETVRDWVYAELEGGEFGIEIESLTITWPERDDHDVDTDIKQRKYGDDW